MSNKSLFGGESHFPNMGSWKAGSPTSNPVWLKAQSRQFFIASVVFVALKHGANTERCRNKWPWRPKTKKSKRNFTVTGISCLDQARTANFGYRKFMKIYGQKSFESISDFNSIIEPDDVRAGLWLPTTIIHPSGLSDVFMSWQTCRTNLFSAVSHIFRTWAAERLAAPLRTHRS